jgi:ABC-type uncharacterized transport system permease subunit
MKRGKFSLKILLHKLIVGVLVGIIICLVMPILPPSIIVTTTGTQLSAFFGTVIASIIGDLQSYFSIPKE